jgi:shikimate kinase
MKKHVIFIGPMGCGKTTLTKALALKRHLAYSDIDHDVEKKYKKTIAEIFKEEGEASFREKEFRALLHALTLPARLISTGAGLPTHVDFFPSCSDHTVIFLKPEKDILEKRLQHDNTRPLSSQWLELYEKRLKLYEKAHYVMELKDLTVDELTRGLEKNYAHLF